MEKKEISNTVQNWNALSAWLTVPKSDEDLDRLIACADTLIDEIGNDETHILNGMLETVGLLIEEYEKRNIPQPAGDPIACLKYLMAEHGLKQKDLTEIGSPGVISDVMNGRRQLNKRQIAELSKRFGCSTDVFM